MKESRDAPPTQKFVYYSGQTRDGLVRTQSKFILFQEPHSPVTFRPDGREFAGSYGIVRTFVSSTGKVIVVKAPRLIDVKPPIIKRTTLEYPTDPTKEEVQHEHDLFKLAYPDLINAVVHLEVAGFYSFRYIQSFIDGKTVSDGVKSGDIETAAELFQLFYAIIDELARIHALGIIHGDPKTDNIIYKKNPDGGLSIYLIDFGCAHLLSESCINYFSGAPDIFAPERWLVNSEEIEIAPHPAQDVYTLLYTFDWATKKAKGLITDEALFNDMIDYFKKSKAIEPEERPTLDQIKLQIGLFAERVVLEEGVRLGV